MPRESILTEGSIEGAIGELPREHVPPLQQGLVRTFPEIFVDVLNAIKFVFRDAQCSANMFPFSLDVKRHL